MTQQFSIDGESVSVQSNVAANDSTIALADSARLDEDSNRHRPLHYHPSGEKDGAVAPAPDPNPARRMGHLLSTLFALVTLIAVGAVAFGTMLGIAALLHHLYPARHFNEFHALHEPIVLGVLLAAAVLWVLPPHSWAARSSEATTEDSAAPKEEVLAD